MARKLKTSWSIEAAEDFMQTNGKHILTNIDDSINRIIRFIIDTKQNLPCSMMLLIIDISEEDNDLYKILRNRNHDDWMLLLDEGRKRGLLHQDTNSSRLYSYNEYFTLINPEDIYAWTKNRNK